MANLEKPHLVAVDTNILLRLAEEDELALDAIEVVRGLLRPSEFLVSPTAYLELNMLARSADEARVRASALKALTDFRAKWRFKPAPLNSLQKTLVINAAAKLLDSGLLPTTERNDARIVVESAVLNCVLLVSNDSHLLQADHRRLGLLFRELDLPVPIIASARDLVRLCRK
jgi:rRNA-processing protein FCF1